MTHPFFISSGHKINNKLDHLANIFNLMTDTERLDLLLKMESSQNEKRNSNRKNFFGLITYSSPKGGHCDFIRDISEDGIFIETSHYIPIGELLSLTFSGATPQQHIKVNGIVARQTTTGIGVKFHALAQQQKDIIQNLFENI